MAYAVCVIEGLLSILHLGGSGRQVDVRYTNCSPACVSSTSGEQWVCCRVGVVMGRSAACATCLLLLSLGLYMLGVHCFYPLVMGVWVPAVAYDAFLWCRSYRVCIGLAEDVRHYMDVEGISAGRSLSA